MANEQEKAAWVIETMRRATRVWAQSTDEPSSDLVQLLGSYYWEPQVAVRDLAFALLADRYSMAQVLHVAAERTKTVTFVREAIARLAQGRRRTQFFSDLLDLVWQCPEEREAFVNFDAIDFGSSELNLLSEAYRRAIALEPSFSLTPSDLRTLGSKKSRLLESVDLSRLGSLLRTCGASLRDLDRNWNPTEEMYVPFGRRRAEIAVGLLRFSDANVRAFGAALADPDEPSARQELAETLAREPDMGVARKCATHLLGVPKLLSTALNTCPVGRSVAYELGRSHRRHLPLPDLSNQLRLSYDGGREERLLEEMQYHLRHEGRLPNNLEFFSALGRACPSLSSLHSGIPRTLLDAVGYVTALTAPEDLVLEFSTGPRLRFLALVVPQASHRELAVLLVGEDSMELALTQEEELDRVRDEIAALRVSVVQDARRLWSAGAADRWERQDGPSTVEDPYHELLPELTVAERSVLRDVHRSEQLLSLWHRYRDASRQVSMGAWKRIASLLPAGIPLPAEGILGTYHPVDRRLIVYTGMIQLFSEYLGCETADLRTLAVLHESAHAVLIHGSDRDRRCWDSFGYTSIDMHEILATIVTERAAEIISKPEMLVLARTVSDRSVCPAAVALLRGTDQKDLEHLIGSTRDGHLDGGRDGMMRALARLLGIDRTFDPNVSHIADQLRNATARSGAQHAAQAMLRDALLRWWCVQTGPHPHQALRLDLTAVEQAIARAALAAPELLLGVGLWPVLRTEKDFLAAVVANAPADSATVDQLTSERR